MTAVGSFDSFEPLDQRGSAALDITDGRVIRCRATFVPKDAASIGDDRDGIGGARGMRRAVSIGFFA